MVDADVTPVAVPLTTGNPDIVTVPAETHVMYWCRLRPVVRDEELSTQKQERQQSQLFHSLLDDVNVRLTVDGNAVHLVGEVIRPDGDREYGFGPSRTRSHRASIPSRYRSRRPATPPPTATTR